MASYILAFIVTLLIFCLEKPSKIQAAPTPRFIPSNVTDRLALLSFKSLLDSGDVLSSWNDSTGVCEWYGITCGKRHPDRVISLMLDSLELGGTISPSLGNLTFLRELYLPGNDLRGVIPEEIGRLRRLRWLNLTSNSLEGEIPGSLSFCLNLQRMSLDGNKLHGIIPANLSRLPNLRYLILKDNMLTGDIPPEFGLFQNLVLLTLRRNKLTGSIPPSIGNISSLAYLVLSNNNLVGSIPSELSKIADLESLALMFNHLSGKIPPALYNFSNLWTFGVGGNRLWGTLPSDFGQNLPLLANLYLYDNHFEGPVPLSLVNASGLELIELGNNSFSGLVPPNLGMIQNLKKLLLGHNKLLARDPNEWRFISSLTNCTFLDNLDLSSNNFSGVLPNSITNLSTTLRWLGLRANKLTGQIPIGIGDLSGLDTLDMAKNQLSGPIPSSIGKLWKLKAFVVTSNKLSGEIPFSLGNLTHMLELYLGDNNFIGSIPTNLASLKKLIVLDISHNNLSGTIPKGVLGISSISLFLNISHNSFTGPLPHEVGSLRQLNALDVSENKFSSGIPGSLGQCLLLEYLNLEGNDFTGEIPYDLRDLKGIRILDLSLNHLSGRIPDFLRTWKMLQYLNLSFNDLEGEVPTQGVFSNLSLFSVEGNEKLCGGDHYRLNLRSCSRKNNKLSTAVIAIITVVVVLCSLCVLFIAYKIFSREKKPRETNGGTSWRGNKFLQLSHADIVRATNGFSSASLIGSGGYGSVYKGILDNDREVAVKVLNQQLRAASKSFMAECKVLRNVRHRNLVRILTACSTTDAQGNEFKALVYEFMPNGSLEKWLDADSNLGTLDLLQRLNIAHDVATAIDYLHTQTETPIVHCDLKPSNILLDSDMTAHVGDFGIARFLSTDAETMTTDIKGSIGYIAPECGMGARISTQWDVYSYGILLLEIFTGKSPTDEAFTDGLTLRKYVEASSPQRILDVADPKLLPQVMDDTARKKFDGNLLAIMRIGLVCSKNSPNDRMQMEDVIRHLDVLLETP